MDMEFKTIITQHFTKNNFEKVPVTQMYDVNSSRKKEMHQHMNKDGWWVITCFLMHEADRDSSFSNICFEKGCGGNFCPLMAFAIR